MSGPRRKLLTDVAVVGGGPAGMTAALSAAESGARVILLERMAEPGRKLLVTGGGRCNLACALPVEEIARRLGRRGRFAARALSRLGPEALRERLSSLGVATVVREGWLVFPASDSAREVRDALARRCRELGVEVIIGERIESLTLGRPGGRIEGVSSARADVKSPAVVIATGGMSRPELGSSGDGYRLAEQAGHSLVEPRPALAEIRLREGWPRRLAGVSVPETRVSIDLPGERGPEREGALIFTHDGISGPAALDASGDVSELLAGRSEVALRVELLPKTPGGFWRGELERWRRERGRSMVRTLLAERLPGALAAKLVELACGAPDARISTLAAGAAKALERTLAGVTVHAVGTGGFDRAMVTRGGVSLGEVDPRTLESRRARGLFFAGEVLDIDGPCGGFNLLWAFSSGELAGKSAAARALDIRRGGGAT